MKICEVKNVNEIEEAIKENFPFSERSYPLKKDINAIMTELSRRIDSPTGGVLAAKDEDHVPGAVAYFFEEEEKYCQTSFIFTAEKSESCNREDVIENLFAQLKSRFSGYDIYVGVDEKFTSVLSYMKKHDIELLESSFDFHLKKDSNLPDFKDFGYEVKKVDEKNFNEYLKLHAEYFDGDGMYWDSRKVSCNFDKFDFYLSGKKGEEAASILFMKKADKNGLCEIYGLCSSSVEESQALLLKAASYSFDNGGTEIMYMTDDDEEDSIAAVSKCGFENIGHYLCFILSSGH